MKTEYFNNFMPASIASIFNDLGYIYNWKDVDMAIIAKAWTESMLEIGKDHTYLAFALISSCTTIAGETYTAFTLDPMWGTDDRPEIAKAREFINQLRESGIEEKLNSIPGFSFLPLSYSEKVRQKQAARRINYKD